MTALSIMPKTANHNGRCQSATQPGCDCTCEGIMHQRDILIAAFESRGTSVDFDVELTRLFGSAFTMISVDPVGTERTRREWKPIASAGAGKRSSQSEQRIVDVTLRDLLRIVHSVPLHQKVGWRDFLDALTLQASWRKIVAQVESVAGPHDEQSGYFWASMLAATSGVAGRTSGAMPAIAVTATAISAFPLANTTEFEHARHPRAKSGIRVQTIKEMASPHAVSIAAGAIDTEWAASPLLSHDKLTVLVVVGAALSADLWRHPAAVRHLLIVAVTQLRATVPGAHFSLDSHHRLVETIIDDELGRKWRDRGVW